MLVPEIRVSGGRLSWSPDGAPDTGDRLEVAAMAEALARCGEISIFDEDAEAGRGDNLPLLKSLCTRFPCRVGGGIRTQATGRALLRAGAERIVVGHDADLSVLSGFRSQHVLIDIGDVLPADRAGEAGGILEKARLTEKLCSGYVIRRDPVAAGTAREIDLEDVHRLSVIAAKPVTVVVDEIGLEEIASLDRIGIDVQVSRAVQAGRLGVPEAFAECMRWDAEGLIPTIVQDQAGQVLMLASSTRESLVRTLCSGEGTFYDHVRGGVWRKGERTGHDQLLTRCRPSCDRRVLLFTVRQAGVACETGRYSCFDDRQFSLPFLSDITSTKKSGDPSSSFTARLISDSTLLATRIREKALAIGDASTREEALPAIADLVYFLVVKAVASKLDWSDVVKELRGRQR